MNATARQLTAKPVVRVELRFRAMDRVRPPEIGFAYVRALRGINEPLNKRELQLSQTGTVNDLMEVCERGTPSSRTSYSRCIIQVDAGTGDYVTHFLVAFGLARVEALLVLGAVLVEDRHLGSPEPVLMERVFVQSHDGEAPASEASPHFKRAVVDATQRKALLQLHSVSLLLSHTPLMRELGIRFHSYVVSTSAEKICPFRAATLGIPVIVPGGMSGAHMQSFAAFLKDCCDLARMTSQTLELSYVPITPLELLTIMLRLCRNLCSFHFAFYGHLGISHKDALSMGAQDAVFVVEWFDFLLLVLVDKRGWGKLLPVVEEFYLHTDPECSDVIQNRPAVEPRTMRMVQRRLEHVACALRPT